MATVQISGLSNRVYRELSARAAANGRTIAAEARAIVEDVLSDRSKRPLVSDDEESASRDRAREKLRAAMIKWVSRK